MEVSITMTPNLNALRLTFNRPAVSQYIDDGDNEIKGLKVRIENGVAQFLPVVDISGGDVVDLKYRTRGGAEAVIEGAMVADLTRSFRNDDGPFFVLTRQKGSDWLSAKPHPSAEAPTKATAQLRVWNEEHGRMTQPVTPKAKTNKAKPRVVAKTDAQVFDLSAIIERIRAARDLSQQHAAARRPGRPSREIVAARNALAAFEDLSQEFGNGSVTASSPHLQVELERVKTELKRTQDALAKSEAALADATQRRSDMEKAISAANIKLTSIFDTAPGKTRGRGKAKPKTTPPKATVAPVIEAPVVQRAIEPVSRITRRPKADDRRANARQQRRHAHA